MVSGAGARWCGSIPMLHAVHARSDMLLHERIHCNLHCQLLLASYNTHHLHSATTSKSWSCQAQTSEMGIVSRFWPHTAPDDRDG